MHNIVNKGHEERAVLIHKIREAAPGDRPALQRKLERVIKRLNQRSSVKKWTMPDFGADTNE